MGSKNEVTTAEHMESCSSEEEVETPAMDILPADDVGKIKEFDQEIERGKKLICRLKDYVRNSVDVEPREIVGAVMIGHLCTAHETSGAEVVQNQVG